MSNKSILKLLIISLVALITFQACSIDNHESAKSISLQKVQQIRAVSKPYALNITCWQINNLLKPVEYINDNSTIVDIKLLRDQIADELVAHGFPIILPVYFRLEKPPYLLVVSPRDRIEYFDRVLLRKELKLEQIETIEGAVNDLGYSSLVVELGGLAAAYPAIVSPSLPLKSMIRAITEEWTHQYLALRPLGFLYVLDSLGINQNEEIVTLNETLAGIIADEIGGTVYERYYRSMDRATAIKEDTYFNFDEEMRLTRKNVDSLLVDGRIDEAEKYMEQRRQIFIKYGYQIRKLNQAYFAFHGIYGQDPASISPMYTDLSALRRSYDSLGHFVDEISGLTSYQQVKDLIKKRLTLTNSDR